MKATLVEAFELLVNAEQLEPRLEAAAAALAQLEGLDEEKAWLASARERLGAARGSIAPDLLNRVLRLPDLESVKGDRARLLQGGIVDALERLHAGIAFAGGARAPLLDVLYHNVKVPPLRRCGREELEKFCADLEKRLGSTYARRMLANETYVVVGPAHEDLRAAIAIWRSVFTAAPLDDAEAAPLREELDAAGQRLDLPHRQARLLAQAALLPAAALLDAAGLTPKKRRGKDVEEDTHPLLENDPPDPDLPTDEEHAELRDVLG